ncbi:MAG TPA: monomethylamine:corrinoid methyltransferase [Dehalococcoidia bacterium]|nr:monomethylamine:corrinoid methyltransferase [Dehalococcoidia bacterium]
MLNFASVVERAFSGPICTERDFELGIFVPNLRRVVEKYAIKYDPQSPVPADDDLADRVWQAGIEFLAETGVYCLDTERRILFSREEIETALKSGPRGSILGEGEDAKAMPRRFPEDETPPWCSVGPTSVPVSNEWNYINLVKGNAENPLADSITIPCLTNVDGRQIVGGSPLGIEGAIRAVLLTREGMRRAGRPGMPIVNGVTTATRSQEHIAAHHFGLRRTDALEIGTIHEMKIDFDSMNKVAYSLAAGSLIFAENGVILGGLAGGPAGVAVVTAAYNPVDLLILRGVVQHPFPTHFDLGVTSARDTIWARSLANQAVTRNSSLPVVNVGYSAAGPMTKMLLYEHSAWVIASVVSGGSVEVGASARGTALDYTSPMEPLFGSEVAHAVAGMSRKEANQIVNALLEKYESKLRDPPVGKKYQECYDVATGKPSQEFIELYREVRREMADQFGLELPPSSPYL